MLDSKTVILVFAFFAFLAGLYFYLTFGVNQCKNKESFLAGRKNKGNLEESCPDLLVKHGKTLLLFNSNLPAKAGENPLPLASMDEYINYLEIQKKQGKSCPVLFLQYENDAQGNDIYRIRPSPFDMQGGLPATVDPTTFAGNFNQANVGANTGVNVGKIAEVLDANRANGPYNQGMFAGFDPQGLHVGEYTTLDAIHDSTGAVATSDNPMDTNWGGPRFTEAAIESGKYEDRYVARPILFTPKTNYTPGVGPMPPNEIPEFLKPKYE